MRILLVEDDELSAEVIQLVLTEARYAVDVAPDGVTGWQLLGASRYDLILLDVMLPNMNGLDFCRQLRERAYDAPVLLVTSLNSSQEKVAGLNAGADDYVTKPFEVEELLARVRALLRRVGTAVVSELTWGDLCLWPNSHEVAYLSRMLALTPKEYALLELFLRSSTQVFSRSAILDRLWSYTDAPGEETVTSHIKGLRKKLSNAGAPKDFIQTVYGVGYRLKPLVDENKEEEKDSGKANRALSERSVKKVSENLPDGYRQKVQIAIDTLWQSAKHRQFDLLEELMKAEITLRSRQLSSEEHRNAYMLAHRMHGSLGIFGLSESAHIADEIQKLIKNTALFSLTEKTRLKTLLDSLEASIR